MVSAGVAGVAGVGVIGLTRGRGARLLRRMRIIAGRFRSRQLHTPKDASTTRPIPDRVKESIFSILRGNWEGAQVLDAFAGTGAIGLEALSRGAERVVFIERDKKSFEMLEKNIAILGVEDEVELVRGDALGTPGINRCPKPVDIAFFDPPYPIMLDALGWTRVKAQLERIVPLLSDRGFLVVRTPWPFRHIEILDEDGKPVSNAERQKFDVYGRPRTDLPPGRKVYHPTKDEDREWSGLDLDADEIQRESDEESHAIEAEHNELAVKYRVNRHEVDLTLAGAAGPETHQYTSQAVHLYMREQAP